MRARALDAVARLVVGRKPGLLLVGVVCTTLGAAGPLPGPPGPPPLTLWQALNSRCKYYAIEPLPPYPWPVAPVHRQHPIRGAFGDPRTVFSGPGEGAFSFHNGVDIAAWQGNHVLPVVSGFVLRVGADQIVVQTADGRRFQYIHIAPAVAPGQDVVVSKTVLGTILPRWNHVHLSEIRDGCAVNPIAPGHLEPYVDATRPTIGKVLFEDAAGAAIPRGELAGRVRVVAQAWDTPPIRSPFPWQSMPVTPALVRWSLTTLGGRIVAGGTAADFRYSEPARADFCQVYAPGTRQNFAAEDGTFHWGEPGRFLFQLTPALDTTLLRRGRYRLTVAASDTAGNLGLKTVLVALGSRGLTGVRSSVQDDRCAASR